MKRSSRPWSVDPVGRERKVEFGRVWCPRNGDIDVETCFTCPQLVEADLGAEPPFVRCSNSEPRDLEELFLSMERMPAANRA